MLSMKIDCFLIYRGNGTRKMSTHSTNLYLYANDMYAFVCKYTRYNITLQYIDVYVHRYTYLHIYIYGTRKGAFFGIEKAFANAAVLYLC